MSENNVSQLNQQSDNRRKMAAEQKKQTGFKPGQSGNPRGRPKGAKHKVTLAAEALLDGEAQALTRKAINQALAGDSVALRLCLERILPPRRDRPIKVVLPALRSPADIPKVVASLFAAVGQGDITPAEAAEVSKLAEAYGRAVETQELEERLARLERAVKEKQT